MDEPSLALALAVLSGAASAADPWYPRTTGRFSLLGLQLVLDRETGLIWPRDLGLHDAGAWDIAFDDCAREEIASVRGWRLPTQFEVHSLVVSSGAAASLPAFHPFQNVPEGPVWTSSTLTQGVAPAPGDPPDVYTVDLTPAGAPVSLSAPNDPHPTVCVRGPGG